MHSPCHERAIRAERTLSSKSVLRRARQRGFLRSVAGNAFGPPEGAGGPKGYGRGRRRRAGKGDRPGSPEENLPSALFASLQAKSRVADREPVGGTNCWVLLAGSEDYS